MIGGVLTTRFAAYVNPFPSVALRPLPDTTTSTMPAVWAPVTAVNDEDETTLTLVAGTPPRVT